MPADSFLKFTQLVLGGLTVGADPGGPSVLTLADLPDVGWKVLKADENEELM